jgi:hypothetical protein
MSVQALVLTVAVVGAAAAGAIVLNLLLLGSAGARADPLGRLTPRTYLPAAPAWTVRPATGRPGDEGADD